MVRVNVIPADVNARTKAASRLRRPSWLTAAAEAAVGAAALALPLKLGGDGRIRKAEVGQFHRSYLNCLEHSVTAA